MIVDGDLYKHVHSNENFTELFQKLHILLCLKDKQAWPIHMPCLVLGSGKVIINILYPKIKTWKCMEGDFFCLKMAYTQMKIHMNPSYITYLKSKKKIMDIGLSPNLWWLLLERWLCGGNIVVELSWRQAVFAWLARITVPYMGIIWFLW